MELFAIVVVIAFVLMAVVVKLAIVVLAVYVIFLVIKSMRKYIDDE